MSSILPPLRSAGGAALALAVTAALVIAGQLAQAGAGLSEEITLATAAITVTWGGLGVLVLVGAPGHRVGRLMAAAGLTAGVALLASSWSDVLALAWVSQWSWWPSYGLIFLALLVFPDGQLPSRRWRPLAGVILAATVLATLAFATAAIDHPRTLLTEVEPPLTPMAQALIWVGAGAVVVAVAGLIGVLVSLVRRWQHADGEGRRQLACLLPAGIVLLLGLVLDVLGLTGAWAITAVAVPLGMTTAILRFRLYDLDLVVNRTIVWLVMTLLLVVAFVAIVALLRDAFLAADTGNASLLATGLIAVSFEPLHRRVQGGVDHLLYGDRDDPYKVIARLGELLGRTGDPTAVLPQLTAAIATSLQVPYVAVDLWEREGITRVAEHGRLATGTEAFPMTYQGRRVGRLLVATRSPGGHFSRHESRLLQDLAVQAAAAAEATRLTRDLQASRERLVVGREEERRRLRRDLHDGLGPSLAGMSMQVRAARRLISVSCSACTGAPRALDILENLAGDLKDCTAEVRQLVDELRPPVLDRGLEEALRAECHRFDTDSLSVDIDVDTSLDGVPAAVEVATYRIVAEALTNVARHSGAQTCRVTVRRTAVALRVLVVDDGRGFATPVQPGVGLTSIRDRVEELGGFCAFTTPTGGGTSVHIELPLEPTLMAVPS